MQVVIGVSGGIAAYKTPELVRLLKQNGFEVRVVLTKAAESFVTRNTLSAFAPTFLYSDTGGTDNMLHITLARWAEYVFIAPASANFIARLTHGFADDLLTTLCVATTARVGIAPAMNCEMWGNAATQANISVLQSRQIDVVGPAYGEQACGEVGLGRMLEPQELCEFLKTKK